MNRTNNVLYIHRPVALFTFLIILPYDSWMTVSSSRYSRRHINITVPVWIHNKCNCGHCLRIYPLTVEGKRQKSLSWYFGNCFFVLFFGCPLDSLFPSRAMSSLQENPPLLLLCLCVLRTRLFTEFHHQPDPSGWAALHLASWPAGWSAGWLDVWLAALMEGWHTFCVSRNAKRLRGFRRSLSEG